ncbi:hypothetical protein [Sphaerisporangium corydalis]|uniref:Uncharacterized protein n=1 Tax=Sphaerisporangium corydalis TaxID=1441875 RepID=A0ABV9E6S6_9ACTN|nr:hypothetical protein [Sphaerisporangium corydalis]
MLVELTMHRADTSQRSANSPIDGIRILALLPEKWHKDLMRASKDIVIRVDTADDTTSDQIQATVTAALTDPAISHWELTSCHPLDPGPSAEDDS